ncbi:MAG: tetratricopeptide repeat protein, partial [Anaerolineae bacterium]|nr:tetratricopeptide repeat protein [Anaerolineae bacterium]
YETAFKHAQQAYQISNELGDDLFAAYILVVMGNVRRAVEDYDQAMGYYQASYKTKEAFHDLGGMAFALNSIARIAWLQGKYQDAVHLYQEGHDAYREVNDPGGLATSMFGLGDAAQAAGDYFTGRRHFQQALKIAVDIHWSPLILEIVTGIADLLLKTDEPEQAVALLSIAIAHPAIEPPTRRRAEHLSEQVRKLLTPDAFDAAGRRGETIGMDKMAQLMLEHLRQQEDDPQHHAPFIAHQGLVGLLTEREMDVLRLMAAGLNNPQIAEKLVVAIGTVKAHTNNIFGKLGVNNRVQAVNRAKELDLI